MKFSTKTLAVSAVALMLGAKVFAADAAPPHFFSPEEKVTEGSVVANH